MFAAEKLLDEGKLGKDHTFEVAIFDTVDHAIVWSVYYYTKDEKSLIKIGKYS